MTRVPELAIRLHPGHQPEQQEQMARLAGRLGFAAVHVETDIDSAVISRLIAAADPALLVVDSTTEVAGFVSGRDLDAVRVERQRLDEQGDRRPLIVSLPVAIGRTRNEAVARAERDPRFVGENHPDVCGIFGTFEQGQEQVLELARAGADVLLVTVADDLDVADLLAQIRALTLGPTEALLSND